MTSRSPLAAAANLPLAVRLPAIAAIVVFAVALITTQAGLSLLEQREEQALLQKAGIFLDTLAGVIAPIVAEDSDAASPATAIAAILSESATYKAGLRDEAVAFCCGDDSTPIITPAAAGTAGEAVLRDHLAALALPAGESAVRIDEAARKLIVARSYAGREDPFVLAGVFDIETLLGERRANRRLALLLDIALALLAAGLAFATTRAMLNPIERLTRALDESSAPVDRDDCVRRDVSGELANLAAPGTEVGRLQRAVKARLEAEDHRARLIAEASERERHAVLARLAASLAHEVRNPLAGLMGAVSTLRRFGDDNKVREETLDLMDRGLATLERVAATTLGTWRPPRSERALRQDDIDDLDILIRPDVKRKSLTYEATVDLSEAFPTDVDAVRQLLLNLLLNACAAAPEGGVVHLAVARVGMSLDLAVADNGPGLPEDVLSVITERGSGAPPPGKRLGLWLVSRLIEDLNGRVAVDSLAGQGTTVRITLPPLADGTAAAQNSAGSKTA